jgi:CHAD domain-containing protein
MARNSKWVEISSPQELAADVATRVLTDRLNLVCRYLERASRGATSDTENVHQLRVSTRRAVAAIANFEPLLPPRRAKWMQRKLKHVRRAAGAARDLDVLVSRIESEREFAESRTSDAVLEFLKSQRADAQQPIDEIDRKLRRKNFRGRIKRLAQRVRDRAQSDFDNSPTFEVVGRETIAGRVQSFLEAGDADLSAHEQLHAFRIEAKQLRYAMEIYAAAFPPEFRGELYPMIAELQEKLGEVNDHATASSLLDRWRGDASLDTDLRNELAAMYEAEVAALHASVATFLDWWTPTRRGQFRDRLTSIFELEPSTANASLHTYRFPHRRAE